MSLTSYRAAPPRAKRSWDRVLAHRAMGPFEPAPICEAVGNEENMQPAFGRPGSDLLSRVLRRSTIGAGAFHGRVRNGTGCSRSAIATRSAEGSDCMREADLDHSPFGWAWSMRTIKPIGLLVPVSFVRYRTSTPGLSTWSSSTALIGTTRFQVGFALRCLQRLSRPYIATLQCRWRDNRSTSGTSTPVLSY